MGAGSGRLCYLPRCSSQPALRGAALLPADRDAVAWRACLLAVRDLAPPGDLTTQMSLPFEFGSVEMQYESYRGTQVCTG